MKIDYFYGDGIIVGPSASEALRLNDYRGNVDEGPRSIAKVRLLNVLYIY